MILVKDVFEKIKASLECQKTEYGTSPILSLS